MADRYEAIVIGSGFGGGISACRLSKRWPGKVMVLERGKRYPMGSFPRTPHDFAQNFWNICDVPGEQRPRPKEMQNSEAHGLFDIRNFHRMDVVLSAGLGGGSLIYANVFMEPPDDVFDERWPANTKKAALAPYYSVAKEVLGSRPIPRGGDPRREIVRTRLFEKVAKEIGRDSKLVDINVFFGNDFNNPLPIGEQARNRYGALQTSCVYCAECDVGCNTHSKNTIDLNYLHVAEHRYGAEVLTEHLAHTIVPVDARGEDDPAADGSNGYRVYYYDLRQGAKLVREALANRVVVSAGTLGSTELLMRCRDLYKTLPRLGAQLGKRFSGNGDFLAFVMGSKEPANPNYGPVITQRIDFNLFKDFNRDHAFVMEDASYPVFASWFVEGIKPRYMQLQAFWLWLRKPGAAGSAARLAGERRLGAARSALGGHLLEHQRAALHGARPLERHHVARRGRIGHHRLAAAGQHAALQRDRRAVQGLRQGGRGEGFLRASHLVPAATQERLRPSAGRVRAGGRSGPGDHQRRPAHVRPGFRLHRPLRRGRRAPPLGGGSQPDRHHLGPVRAGRGRDHRDRPGRPALNSLLSSFRRRGG